MNNKYDYFIANEVNKSTYINNVPEIDHLRTSLSFKFNTFSFVTTSYIVLISSISSQAAKDMNVIFLIAISILANKQHIIAMGYTTIKLLILQRVAGWLILQEPYLFLYFYFSCGYTSFLHI